MNLETTNQLDMALWSGFVPPSSTVANLPQNLNFAAPFQAAFNSYLQYGQSRCRPTRTSPSTRGD